MSLTLLTVAVAFALGWWAGNRLAARAAIRSVRRRHRRQMYRAARRRGERRVTDAATDLLAGYLARGGVTRDDLDALSVAATGQTTAAMRGEIEVRSGRNLPTAPAQD